MCVCLCDSALHWLFDSVCGCCGFHFLCLCVCLLAGLCLSLSLPLSRSAVMIFIAIFAAGGLGGEGWSKVQSFMWLCFYYFLYFWCVSKEGGGECVWVSLWVSTVICSWAVLHAFLKAATLSLIISPAVSQVWWVPCPPARRCRLPLSTPSSYRGPKVRCLAGSEDALLSESWSSRATMLKLCHLLRSRRKEAGSLALRSV